MSIILLAARKRDLHKKRKVIRKAGQSTADGQLTLTHAWNLEVSGKPVRISFSRDNCHAWVNGEPVEVTGYISDKGFDLDLFFDIGSNKCHIFSDVEGSTMTNHLYINDNHINQD